MDTTGPSGTPTPAESGVYVTSAGRSRNMAAIRRKDTKPEVELRSALHRRGYRFRKDYPIRVDGKLLRPDIAFTRQKIAVFIDGCFWHCCPQHGHQPNVNNDYWSIKLQGNVARDRKQTATLQDAGWQVLRFWEHEDLDRVISRLVSLIQKS